MLDNEEPWRPPTQEKPSEVFRIGPQVPELTIIGVESRQTPKNGNFLQRALNSEKSRSNTSPNNFINNNNATVTSKSPNEVIRQQAFPSPPDFRLNNAINSGGNQYKISNRPQVPDVTLLDDGSISKPAARRSTDRVFTESYKEMLVSSHDQFLKQLNGSRSPSSCSNVPATQSSQNAAERRRSPFFTATTAQYKQNPLAKYAPSCDQIQRSSGSKREKDANTSSILIDISNSSNSEKKSPAKATTAEENDEVTFKKVAEMLSEIQKLVIPGAVQQAIEAPPPPPAAGMRSEDELKGAHNVLRQLAIGYLHPEEIIKYQIESELDELAKS